MNLTRVSVIIPVYNVSAYLEKCLSSAVEQTLHDIEIIVVNDGSTDNSQNIIDEYAVKDARIISLKKENGGVVAARETGVKKARGEYLYFLDGDDYLSADAMEVLYAAAKKENADIVAGDFYTDEIAKNILIPHLNADLTTTDNTGFLKLLLLDKCNPSISVKLFKRTLYTDNPIEIPPHFIYGEDTIPVIQLAYYAKTIAKVNHFVLYYVQRDTSATRTKISSQGLENLVELPYWVEKFLLKKNVLEFLQHEMDVFFVNTFMWSLGAKGYENAHERSKAILKRIRNNSRLLKEMSSGMYSTIYAFSKSQVLGMVLKISVPRIRTGLSRLPGWIGNQRLVQQFIKGF